MKCLFLIAALICISAIICGDVVKTQNISNTPNSNKPAVKVSESRIDVEIDASDKIGIFNEKVLYNLEFDNNELKSVGLKKILPHIDSEFFDVKVTSNDVKILKYEIKNEELLDNKPAPADNFNQPAKKVKNKVLVITFEGKDQKNFNQGAVNIEYYYKVKEITTSVKDTYYFKDIDFYEEFSASSYPTKFSVNIKNLPENVKIKNLEFDNTLEAKVEDTKNQGDNYNNAGDTNSNKVSFVFENKNEGGVESSSKKNNNTIGGSVKNKKVSPAKINKYSNSYKTLRFALENKSEKTKANLKRSAGLNENSSTATPTSHYNTSNGGNTQTKSYVYYTKKKNNSNSSSDPSIWETIVAVLMVICICYLCCNCWTSHSSDTAYNKNDGNSDPNHIPAHETAGPDGFVTYYN